MNVYVDPRSDDTYQLVQRKQYGTQCNETKKNACGFWKKYIFSPLAYFDGLQVILFLRQS